VSDSPTSGDSAWSESQRNALSLQDAMVLIGWLAHRVRILENESGRIPYPLPDMPSKINGFSCLNVRSRAVQDAWADILREQMPLRNVVLEQPNNHVKEG
jgi:hypothetical protein